MVANRVATRFVVSTPLTLRRANSAVTVSPGSRAPFTSAFSEVRRVPAGRMDPPSLSMMVRIAAFGLSNDTWPVGLESERRMVSAPSSMVSSMMGTEKVFNVSPLVKTSVPLTPV